jgi:hypothetical protein
MRDLRTLALVLLSCCALAAAETPAVAQAVLPSNYTITPIAIETPSIANFGALTPDPAINNFGTVAFGENTPSQSGAFSYYAGNGTGALTMIINGVGPIVPSENVSLSINDSGFIAFSGFQSTATQPVVGVYTSNGSVLNTIETVSPICGFIGLDQCTTFSGTVLHVTIGNTGFTQLFSQDVSINNAGAVAFGDLTISPTGIETGANQVINAGSVNTVASTDSGFSQLGFAGGLFFLGVDPLSINDQSTVSFYGTDSAGLTGIFVGNGTTLTIIAHDGGILGGQVTGNLAPSLNDSGNVSLVGTNVPPGTDANPTGTPNLIEVFTGNGQTVGVIAGNCADPNCTNANSNIIFGSSAINDNNIVTYLEALGAITTIDIGAPAPLGVVQIPPTETLMYQSGGTALPLQTGSALAGSTITSLSLGPHAINDNGQITFRAQLANGQEGIFRADPAGSTAVNPFLPNSTIATNTFVFNLVDDVPPCALVGVPCTFHYVDPAIATAYDYTIDPSSAPFAGVLLPVGLGSGSDNNTYDLTLSGVDTGIQIEGGVPFYFATAGLTDLHEFGITGIDPAAMLDPSDALAFPTGVEFGPGPIVGDLEMIALTGSNAVAAPEPSTLALFAPGAFGMVVLGIRRRRIRKIKL